MKKRVTSIVLILCMILSLLPTAALAASGDFTDLPAATHWAYSALTSAVDNGLLKGDNGKLSPEGLLTRAQLAAVINRALGATKKADISSYTDVSASAWYAEDIAMAVEMGTFSGSGGGLMRPEDAVTRQEAFAVLARAFHLEDGGAAELAAFTDAGSVASWAVPTMAAMVKAGYVKGSGALLRPLGTITRQEFAQVMYNLLRTYYTVPGFDGTISKVISGYTTGTWYNSAGTHEITVSYEGKTAKFNVTVVAKTLDRIAVTTMPSQTTYDKINESLSLSTTGIVVKAYYLSLTTMPQASPSPTLRRPLATRISQTPSP